MRGRLGTAAALALAVTVVAACSSGSDGPTGSSLPSQVTPTSSGSSPGSSGSASMPTSASPTQVPVDQIPPGNPASWVPAGVPTTAKYAEPGDKPPMFTPVMFQHTKAGAEAMARYYVTALNWVTASQSVSAVSIICTATACSLLTKSTAATITKGQHVVGARVATKSLQMLGTRSPGDGEWVARTRLQYSAGAVVANADNKTIQQAPASALNKDIYLQWTGRLWHVVDDLEPN